MVRDSTVLFAVFGIMLSTFAFLLVKAQEVDRSFIFGMDEALAIPVWLLGIGMLGFLMGAITERKNGS